MHLNKQTHFPRALNVNRDFLSQKIRNDYFDVKYTSSVKTSLYIRSKRHIIYRVAQEKQTKKRENA
jgi:hypothetical protein